MTLSRSESALRRWAARAIAAFLVVYMLGAFGVPTLVLYVTVLLAVIADGVRSFVQSRRRPRAQVIAHRPRGETLH